MPKDNPLAFPAICGVLAAMFAAVYYETGWIEPLVIAAGLLVTGVCQYFEDAEW